jgi:hypothetical protein
VMSPWPMRRAPPPADSRQGSQPQQQHSTWFFALVRFRRSADISSASIRLVNSKHSARAAAERSQRHPSDTMWFLAAAQHRPAAPPWRRRCGFLASK